MEIVELNGFGLGSLGETLTGEQQVLVRFLQLLEMRGVTMGQARKLAIEIVPEYAGEMAKLPVCGTVGGTCQAAKLGKVWPELSEADLESLRKDVQAKGLSSIVLENILVAYSSFRRSRKTKLLIGGGAALAVVGLGAFLFLRRKKSGSVSGLGCTCR